MSTKNFYITTTLPYTNSDPHIGFAKEIIKADVIARWQRLLGREVFFNTGTDEHGLKIFKQAQAAGLEPRQFCDHYAGRFLKLKEALNLSFTNFIRTSDESHILAVQEFWRRCQAQGDIYKKTYQVKYCVGCELEKTDSDLENGRCPFHPNQDLELISEENYFFRFSKYQEPLLKFYREHPEFVIPQHRFKEIYNFVAAGLQDFSISRLKSKLKNGVPVPDDDEQVIYVWFDALVNYISTLGWPNDEAKLGQYWPGVQVCGKDNLRQQAAMWPAMLMSAGLPLSKQVLIFGFLTANGQKISKSLGNSIDPFLLVEKYGADALRYYLLSDIPTFEDGDFSEDRLATKYQADLANVLGNFASRLSTLLAKQQLNVKFTPQAEQPDAEFFQQFSDLMSAHRLNDSLQLIWKKLRQGDEKLTKAAPWKLTDQDQINLILKDLTAEFLQTVYLSSPFLPDASAKILAAFSGSPINKINPLFPRLT